MTCQAPWDPSIFPHGRWDSNPAPPPLQEAPCPEPWPAQMLQRGLGDQKRRHPGLAAPAPPLGETSEAGLSPGAWPHPPHFSLPCGGGEDSYCQPLGSSLGSILLNFMLQKDVLHCFAFSLVRVVCRHVVLGVNDLRISTIIPKSNSCCTAGQKYRKSVLSPCTDII